MRSFSTAGGSTSRSDRLRIESGERPSALRAEERAEQAYRAECERIGKMLEEKGFGLTGNEDPINLANRALSRSREDHRPITEPND